jgi:carbonic anhydrase
VHATTVFSWAGMVSAYVLIVVACGADDEQPTPSSPTPTVPASSGEQLHWSYVGESGPDEWGELSPDFVACEAGDHQSPIDLADAQRVDVPDIQFLYEPAAYQVINTGHTIQANAADAGGITVDGQHYELVQFHAHVPSEHTMDGEPADLEVHLVHQSSTGEAAVVAVLMNEGAANTALAEALSPSLSAGGTAAVSSLDAAGLLPTNHLTYRYDGSLTTPPCTEGVRWLVLQQHGSVDAATVDSFSSLFGPNARPVQPLHARELLLDLSTS